MSAGNGEVLLSIISLVVGLLGILLAYIFYRRSLRNKEPFWDTRTVNLVQGLTNKLEGLTLLYGGKEVSNISVTKLVFWNNGHTTIDGSDVPSTDPIRIAASPDYRILHTSIIAQNNAPSEFRLAQTGPRQVALEFEYVDKGQGMVVQVIHEDWIHLRSAYSALSRVLALSR